jgi:hypothetical protein
MFVCRKQSKTGTKSVQVIDMYNPQNGNDTKTVKNINEMKILPVKSSME